jgi:hypothetical protein
VSHCSGCLDDPSARPPPRPSKSSEVGSTAAPRDSSTRRRDNCARQPRRA